MPIQTGKTLFSQHYLETRLPALPEWAEDCSEAFARLVALRERVRAILPTLNESQTEQEFVKPALEILGWSFIVQVKAGGGGSLTLAWMPKPCTRCVRPTSQISGRRSREFSRISTPEVRPGRGPRPGRALRPRRPGRYPGLRSGPPLSRGDPPPLRAWLAGRDPAP
jgi:hypothetical protein